MSNNTKRTVAIAGTGLSAIFAAIRIRSQMDVNLLMFDKARGLGGRLATRRVDNGKFDHGAQYFNLSELKEIPEIKELIDSKIICSLENSDKFFAPGGMTNIAKFLLEGFDIKKQHKLIDFKKNGHEYILNFENTESLACNDLILSCPMPQTIEILENSDPNYLKDFMTDLSILEYEPCIVLMIKSKNKLAHLNKELGNLYEGRNISWVGDNSLKQVSDVENFYTVQCNENFSKENFENEYERTNDLLKTELETIFGDGYEILSNHKWRYSVPKNFYEGDDSLIIREENFIGLCGDIFTNGKFSGAIKSGISIADKYVKNGL